MHHTKHSKLYVHTYISSQTKNTEAQFWTTYSVGFRFGLLNIILADKTPELKLTSINIFAPVQFIKWTL